METTYRNYSAEMLAKIREAIPDWDYVPSVVAQNLVEELEANDPELMVGWLYEQAVPMLANLIVEFSRANRRTARATATRGRFDAAAKRFEAGEETALNVFRAEFVVDVENTRRKIGDMTGPDHLFVARSYRKSEKKSAMEAAFHEAVAEKIGERSTKEVFTEESYTWMYRSIVGK